MPAGDRVKTFVRVTVALAAVGCSGEDGGREVRMVDDPDQASIVALYEADPVAYWARFGLPTLSRATLQNEQLRVYGDAFGVLAEAFLPDAFAEAVGTGDGLTATAHEVTLAVPTGPHVSLLRETGTMPGGSAVALSTIECAVWANADAGCDVEHLHACDPAGIYIGAEGPFPDPDPEGCGYGPVRAEVDPWLHAQLSIRALTQWLDGAVAAGDDAAIAELTSDLASIYQVGFDAAIVDEALAPQPELHDPDAELPDGPICAPPPDDVAELPAEMLWTEVRDSRAWMTAKDGMCAALAAGACAARLGLHDDKVTCEEWGTISEQLNATATGGVADMFDVERWIKDRARARGVPLCRPRFLYRTDPPVSMCAQAYVLRNLGCDVMVHYRPPMGPRHVELVTDVQPLLEPDPDRPDTDCVFQTLSWGRSATVEIQRDNTFRNKSDRSRYSEQLDGGLAAIYSFCPCDKVPEDE